MCEVELNPSVSRDIYLSSRQLESKHGLVVVILPESPLNLAPCRCLLIILLVLYEFIEGAFSENSDLTLQRLREGVLLLSLVEIKSPNHGFCRKWLLRGKAVCRDDRCLRILLDWLPVRLTL